MVLTVLNFYTTQDDLPSGGTVQRGLELSKSPIKKVVLPQKPDSAKIPFQSRDLTVCLWADSPQSAWNALCLSI